MSDVLSEKGNKTLLEAVPSKMLSLRLPNALINQIEKIAKAKGWTKTEVIQYALDQFALVESKSR